VASTTLRPPYSREKDGAYCTGGSHGPRSQSRQHRDIVSPLGFDPRTVQPIESRYTRLAACDITAACRRINTRRLTLVVPLFQLDNQLAGFREV
jgi:hypothetical protein